LIGANAICLAQLEESGATQGHGETMCLLVDDSLNVPVTYHHISAASLDTAVQDMWRVVEKRPLTWKSSLAALDVTRAMDFSVLLLSSEHGICDGVSLTTVAHELMCALEAVNSLVDVQIPVRSWGAPCEVAGVAGFSELELQTRMGSFEFESQFVWRDNFPFFSEYDLYYE